MRQWPQGLWVVTPEGKVLGFHYHKPKPGETYAEGQKRWVRDSAQMVRDAIAEAGPLPPRDVKARPDPFADRGKGVNPDGGVRLAASVIPTRNGRQDGPPVVDSVHLNADQWAGFRPPPGEVKVGQTWTVPADAARRFAPAFSPLTDSIFSPKPEDVTAAAVAATVERVTDGTAVVRFAGSWATFHNRDGDPKYPIRTTSTGEGVGVYDTATGKPTAIAWLLAGTYQNGPPTTTAQRTVAVVEWAEGK